MTASPLSIASTDHVGRGLSWTPTPGRWVKGALVAVDLLSIAALYAYMLSHSWLRWLDPLIDFPRELYMAWRMSVGDQLYLQLANWYGPLPQLTQAAGFRLFGSGLDTIVWMNIALTGAVLFLLRGIFRALGSPLMGWLAPVVFLAVFAFGHYNVTANYNFITPYVAQSTYSFFGLLLVVWGLLRHLHSGRPGWLGVAGWGLAVAYLDKPEAVLAAVGALAFYLLAQWIRQWRAGGNLQRGGAKSAGWFVGGFLSLWLPVFGYFWAIGGIAYAWRAVNYAFATLQNSAILGQVTNEKLMQAFIGFDHPWQNFLLQARAGFLLVAVCGGMAWLARSWTLQRKFGPGWWLLPGLVVIVGGVGAWLAQHDNYWSNLGSAFVFPVCLATLAATAWGLWAVWHNRPEGNRAVGLAVVGLAASLMLARMILQGRFAHYGFYLMPLAVLYWLHLALVEASRPAPGSLRRNGWMPAVFLVLVLYGAFVLGRFNLSAYAQKNYEVGSGRDHFYTFQPEADANGWLVNVMVDAYREKTPDAKTLVAFPEGIMVNYLLRVPTSLTQLEFNPLALSYGGTDEILAELKAHPPEVVFLFNRDYSEYGVKYFGADKASGSAILLWLNENQKIIGFVGKSQHNVTGHAIDQLVPKQSPTTLNVPGLPLLPQTY